MKFDVFIVSHGVIIDGYIVDLLVRVNNYFYFQHPFDQNNYSDKSYYTV